MYSVLKNQCNSCLRNFISIMSTFTGSSICITLAPSVFTFNLTISNLPFHHAVSLVWIKLPTSVRSFSITEPSNDTQPSLNPRILRFLILFWFGFTYSKLNFSQSGTHAKKNLYNPSRHRTDYPDLNFQALS